MSVFDQHTNKDDSFIRSVIVGLLATLQENVNLKTQLGPNSGNFKETFIKFYFSTTGSERYLNDNFLNSVDFDPDYILSESFYAELPRGLVEFSSIVIESDSITNKYVRTTHKKVELDGNLNTYNSETFFVPLKLEFAISVFMDNMIDQLKLTESVIKNLYKNINFKIEHNFNLVQCVLSLPEDLEGERPIEYSFSDKKEYKITFNCEVRTYMPVFLYSTTLFEGNRMNTLISNTNLVKNKTVIETGTRQIS